MPVDLNQLQLFLPAALLLVVIPGPDTLLVLSVSLVNGRSRGFVTTLGILVGNIVQTGIAAVGLSAAIAASPLALGMVRYGGGGWLAWLGFKALSASLARNRMAPKLVPSDAVVSHHLCRGFLSALATNLLNVKVILFNLSFVPQFIEPKNGQVTLQIVIFCLLSSTMGAVYMMFISASASSFRNVISNESVSRYLNFLTGILFFGFSFRLFVL